MTSRGRRELLLICTALMMWDSHCFKLKDKFLACRTTCVCLYHGQELVVSCRGNKLNHVPRGIPENVTELDLSDNVITEIEPATFCNLTHLKQLYLGNNSLTRIREGVFDNLRRLERLYLKDNLLEELPVFGESLQSLLYLFLSNNKIRDIQPKHVTKISSVQHLYLDKNRLKEVPSGLKNLTKLKDLNLNFNNISVIHKDDFRPLKNLVELKLYSNRISKIEEGAFPPLLVNLILLRNNISFIPNNALKSLRYLQKLDLGGNPIKCIHDNAFEGLQNLSEINLSWKNIEIVEHNAFVNLPKIDRLSLINVKLTRFPNLTGTTALKILALESNDITSLPENFCAMFPHLFDFNANMNKITRIPDMSRCSAMKLLKLDYNRITTIGSSLQNMPNLQGITLNGNFITAIPENAFKGDTMLERLKMANNNIRHIADTAFVSLENLEFLDLSYNLFPSLPLQGMQSVLTLYVRGNVNLKEISSESLPNIRIIKASYPYHCCQFRKRFYNTNSMEESYWNWVNNSVLLHHLRVDRPENSTHPDADDGPSGLGSGLSPFEGDDEGSGSENFAPFSSNDELDDMQKPRHQNVNCTPLTDPFFPCDDLMGSWLLRVGVWIVFLLALLGNAIVVMVILLSNTKIDVSRFLIINLAMADICMGVYLGLLAFVDARTMGDFMHHGVDWQQSHGCKVAGFLAVLSSEASVFTLAVITIERFIAIRHALHVDRKMSLRKTAIIMIFGWIIAIIIATLPLHEISDYAKFSVCLPFETGDVKSLAFVTLILCLNCIAFIIIFACYVGIYFEIRGSNAWNTSDTQVAMRMALLVVTDFACWAPIVIIAFPAAFGMSFVSLEEAKVFTIFVFPLNSCANPFLYAIFTYQFKKDCMNICRRVKNSPVPPKIQIALSKKRFSMSGGQLEQRRGSHGSVTYYPETNSDGRVTLKVPELRFSRRYSLPAAFKLNPLQRDKRSSRGSSVNDNSQSSNEHTTDQTTVAQERVRFIDRRTAV